jgi:hypothetical protein
MAGKNDHLIALANPARDLSDPGSKPATVAARLGASDPGPAKVPADPAASVAATAHGPATALAAL